MTITSVSGLLFQTDVKGCDLGYLLSLLIVR